MGDLHAKKAMVDSATFNVRRLEETQRFQKVYAPFDGVITARNIDIGALIDAGANAPGKELFDHRRHRTAARLRQRARRHIRATVEPGGPRGADPGRIPRPPLRRKDRAQLRSPSIRLRARC